MKHLTRHVTLLLFVATIAVAGFSQPITGVWKGKLNNRRVEVKFVQKGDSIVGTSYYAGVLKDFRRYSIKGYFDLYDNSIVWWNHKQIYPAILEEDEARKLFSADYNCPGGTKMFLTSDPQKQDNPKVDLAKATRTDYPDEWNYIFDNYQFGANRPAVIDSIALVAFRRTDKPVIIPQPTILAKAAATHKPATPVIAKVKKVEQPIIAGSKPADGAPVTNRKEKAPVKKPADTQQPVVAAVTPQPLPPPIPFGIKEKFAAREKVFVRNIPLQGDSIQLEFYDNAEVDGDSISLFLNNTLLFEHILLSGNPFTFKLATKYLGTNNDLVMVAENLGSIPPNTAYMVVISGGKRYDAQIVSTEKASALIRFKKE